MTLRCGLPQPGLERALGVGLWRGKGGNCPLGVCKTRPGIPSPSELGLASLPAPLGAGFGAGTPLGAGFLRDSCGVPRPGRPPTSRRLFPGEVNVGGIVAAVVVLLMVLALVAFGVWFAYRRGFFSSEYRAGRHGGRPPRCVPPSPKTPLPFLVFQREKSK